MPYLAHFGLEAPPFTLTPDIDFYFPSHDHANIINSIEFALRRDSGIIKIVGEVGTGKTLLCRLLIDKLVNSESVAYINAPQANERSIVRTICEEFGITLEADEAASPYSALNRFLVEEHAQGRMAVVIVDEAQHLGRDGLEAVRLVSNLETGKNKLLQIVLFGQTELDDLLRDPSLRQLNQRLVFSFTTKPLTANEAKRYVGHRARVSRRPGVEYDLFSPAALEVIAKQSGGIPRVINILADKSLLVAYAEGSPVVQRAHAIEAVKDSPGLVPGARAALFFRWKAIAAGALALLLTLGGGWLLGRDTKTVPAPLPVAVAAPAPVAVPAPAPVEVPPVIQPVVQPVAVAPEPPTPPIPKPKPKRKPVVAHKHQPPPRTVAPAIPPPPPVTDPAP